MLVHCVLQPSTRPCPEERPVHKVPSRLAAGLVGTAQPGSPPQVQRQKEPCELISLFLVGMSTAWDLGAGRVLVPAPLGRALVLTGSAPCGT